MDETAAGIAPRHEGEVMKSRWSLLGPARVGDVGRYVERFELTLLNVANQFAAPLKRLEPLNVNLGDG
jgi:hypothetical protein